MPIRRNRPKLDNFNRNAQLSFQLRLKDFEIAIQDVYDLFFEEPLPWFIVFNDRQVFERIWRAMVCKVPRPAKPGSG